MYGSPDTPFPYYTAVPLGEVPMLDSEEQVQQHLPILLPKAKFKSPGDSDEDTDEDAPAVTPSAGNPEVPSSSTQSLGDQIHALTTWFDTY